MRMEIRQCILTGNDCYKRGVTIAPIGIMMHDTGADNKRLKRYLAPDDGLIGKNDYGNDWNRPGVGACVHAFIGEDVNGEVQCYQTLPWNMRSWHCGADANGTHISIEICQDGKQDRGYFLRSKNAAVELCAKLCMQFGFDPMKQGVLISHYEGYKMGIASGHDDVEDWWPKFGYTMGDFRREVAAKIAELMEPEEKDCGCTALEARVEALEKAQPKRYRTFLDVPEWAKPEIRKLIEDGLLFGEGDGILNLSEDLLRTLVVLQRIREKGAE